MLDPERLLSAMPLIGDQVKIVYFLTSYQSPKLLIRTLRTIRRGDPDAHIVLHHDTFQSQISEGEFADLGVHLFTSDHPIIWGDLTLEAVRWRVFRWMLAELDFDWVVLLSEQDYPIAALPEFHKYLAQGSFDAVIDAQLVDPAADFDDVEEIRNRCSYSYAALPNTGLARRFSPGTRAKLRRSRVILYSACNRAQPWIHFQTFPEALQLPTKIGVRRSSERFRPDFSFWFHSAWYALSRRAVEHVIRFLDANPEFVRFAARSIIPLEFATGSIVLNDPQLRVKNAAIHYVRFDQPGSARPDFLHEADLPAVFNSGCFFARKFSLDDTRVLDLLDERVLAGLSAH